MTTPSVNPIRFVAMRVSTGVNVSATHPTLGPVYWLFASGADCNAPDFYSITDDVGADGVLTLPRNWRDGSYAFMHRSHMGRIWNDKDQISSNLNEYGEPLDEQSCQRNEHGDPIMVTTLHGLLKTFQEKSGQSVDEFMDWLGKAEWVDTPAPQRARYLEDVNEFCGFHPIWTQEIADATTFSAEDVAIGKDSTDCHVAYAASVARFIPFPAAQ